MKCLTRFSIVLCSGFFLGGCSLIDSTTHGDLDWHPVPGIIEFYGDVAEVVISADTVQVDETLEVMVTTFGGGCERVGGAQTKVSDLMATIEPFDYTRTGSETVCTEELKFMPRTVPLHFRKAGIAILRIPGLKVDSGGRRMAVLERNVVVRR